VLRRPAFALGGAIVGAFLACLGWGCAPRDAEGAPDPAVRFSLLAVGDTGEPAGWWKIFEGRLAVARGLATEHRRQPADAFALLGDNFYPKGVSPDDLLERVRHNVVSPYCPFVALTPEVPPALRAACPEPGAPGPLFAVLGNHDYGHSASPRLQRQAIPEWVGNWTMAPGAVALHRPAEGVDVILVETEEFLESGSHRRPLVEALRASRGPWRILVLHRPLAFGPRGTGALAESSLRRVETAILRADVPIHVALSGDDHNLALVRMDAPGPLLNVIAGSGSSLRAVREPHERMLFALADYGFARVDRVVDAAGDRLVVSLFRVSRFPRYGEPQRVARWAVAPDGTLRED
jgi:hypothetical protein